jgi:sensor histidine kinase YesM
VKYLIIVNFIIKIFYIVCSLITRATESLIIQRREYSQLKLATLSAELSLLKNQTNPHFLFNTLNALYTSAYKFGDTTTANGIGQMSALMRFMLHKNVQEKLLISEEIDQIEAFIAIQEFRFKEKVVVTFDYENINQDILISPMLLMPLVENAFKYGIHTGEKNTISIKLTQQNQQIVFTIKNSDHSATIKASEQFQPSGIGLLNLKQRLALLYKNNHQLFFSAKNDEYHAILELSCL